MSLHRVQDIGFLTDISRGDVRPWLQIHVARWWFTLSRPDDGHRERPRRVLALTGRI